MMKRLLPIVILCGAAVSIYTFFGMHHHKEGLMIVEPFARATTVTAKAGGAFITIHNGGPNEDRLIEAVVNIAHKTELHTHKIDVNNIAQMVKIEGGIALPIGMTHLKPGGDHIMMMGLQKQLIEGETIQITLRFEMAEPITVEVPIKALSHMGSGEHSH